MLYPLRYGASAAKFKEPPHAFERVVARCLAARGFGDLCRRRRATVRAPRGCARALRTNRKGRRLARNPGGPERLVPLLHAVQAVLGYLPFAVQEFIAEAGGSDIRCLVIGDKVVAAMRRQGKEGEFRSNLHRGGTASLVKITPEERRTAVRSARIMGLNVAGVDLLRSARGPVVMEVNSSPGLEGIETATGKDIAGLVIQFIEKNARPGRTRTRGRG